MSLWIEKDTTESGTPINTAVFESYYNQIKQLADSMQIPVPADWFQVVLRMPDVMTKVEIQELSEEEWEVVHKVIIESIEHLVDFRKQEGCCFREEIHRENQ